MPLIASDGYEYEDLKARLLGEPKDNRRNRAIKLYRRQHYSETSIKSFYQAFDKAFAKYGRDCEEVLDAALEAARATRCFGPLAYKDIQFSKVKPLTDHKLRAIVREAIFGPIEPDPGRDRTGVPAPESSPPAPLHPADQPSVPCGLGT